METKLVELKKKAWKKAKAKFLTNVPKRFKIRVDGLEDGDTRYYHPVIILSEGILLRGQGDTDSDFIYAENLEIEKKITVGNNLFTLHLNMHCNEERKYVLNNFEKIKDELVKSFDEIEKIYELKESLHIIQRNIIETTISEKVDKSKIKDSIEKIYQVTEYLENKRFDV